MILVGSQRGGATALANHLMNDRDNDHVRLLDIRGFMAQDLHGALNEAHAVSKATRCKQFMFSLSLNPPQDHVADEEMFQKAADLVEAKLGLSDQPRAIVIHEKEGRRHAHVVWSRIDGEALKAINLPHFKNKLKSLSRDLFLEHGWDLPEGLKRHGGKNPLNFTLQEWQQAKRQDLDPREIKQTFRQALEASDNLQSLTHALEERGYFLAKGDRRGFVVLDTNGQIYSLPRWSGVKTKDVKAKLGDPEQLRPVSEVQTRIRAAMTSRMKTFISDAKERHREELKPLRGELSEMKAMHRQERMRLYQGQEERWNAEAKERSERLNHGLRGLFDRLSGKAKAIQQRNEIEARACADRDREQRDFMAIEQMKERIALRDRFQSMKDRQKHERQMLARDISSIMRPKVNPAYAKQRRQYPEIGMMHQRDQGPDLSP
ncbi:relaxase/mobilization nuclease domain-containing protein [Tritonibacter mobilis]|uniref:relaxase/mobilization nuclease domain-containing protein n=1 Tax=Tritonibacter mobilis TaxID=379347 RepID=UPI000806A2D1|nr:relaxase/mobilization nuclease domain-containing protein [Tritonibacter mobilis]